MNCFLATASVVFNMMWIIPSPQVITGMSDRDECIHMAIEGCTMVDKCSPGTLDEQTFSYCYKKAEHNCDKYKDKR